MKKAAPKSRTKATRRSRPTKTITRSSASLSWWDRYCRDRDDFYRCHPNIQWLLAIFILVFLFYLGLLFTSTTGYRLF